MPTILSCCQNHVCFACAESDRAKKISELTGNAKRIQCMYCNRLFHSSRDTPWIVNKTLIEFSGLDVDLSAVREAQSAMRDAPARRVAAQATGGSGVATSGGAGIKEEYDTDTDEEVEDIARDLSEAGGMGGANNATSQEEHGDSDDGSRFSHVSEPCDIPEERDCASDAQETTENDARNNPLRQSCLITREQLHCITGGKRGGHKNPLKVGTPMGFCGGPAIAMSGGKVHHICLKWSMNYPLPKSEGEPFLMYRRAKANDTSQQRDVQQLADYPYRDHPPIPVFWEPEDQEGTKVRYVGHWKVVDIEDHSDKPITYLEIPRSAVLKLSYVDFDSRWDRIIRDCQDKEPSEIKAMKWGDDEDGSGPSAEKGTKQTRKPASLTSTVRRSKRKR